MSLKSRQAYARMMRDSYFVAPCIEIFFHAGSRVLPSNRGWHRRGWYWRDTATGYFGGPFRDAEGAEIACFAE